MYSDVAHSFYSIALKCPVRITSRLHTIVRILLPFRHSLSSDQFHRLLRTPNQRVDHQFQLLVHIYMDKNQYQIYIFFHKNKNTVQQQEYFMLFPIGARKNFKICTLKPSSNTSFFPYIQRKRNGGTLRVVIHLGSETLADF